VGDLRSFTTDASWHWWQARPDLVRTHRGRLRSRRGGAIPTRTSTERQVAETQPCPPHRPTGPSRWLVVRGFVVIQAPDALLLTDGVVLVDRFTNADVDALWAGEDDGYVRRSRLPGPFTRRDIANQIRQWQDQWHLGGTGRAFAIREAGSRRLVGGCLLEIRADDSEIAELSYWVFPPYRCRGYASRAVELVCRHAFDNLSVVRLELCIEPTNHASLRVACKTGFLRERLPGQRDRCDRDRSDMVLVSRPRRAGPQSEPRTQRSG